MDNIRNKPSSIVGDQPVDLEGISTAELLVSGKVFGKTIKSLCQ